MYDSSSIMGMLNQRYALRCTSLAAIAYSGSVLSSGVVRILVSLVQTAMSYDHFESGRDNSRLLSLD